MKKFLAVAVFCLPAFGQAAYLGLGSQSSSAAYVSGSGCAAPNFCAYSGVDLIPWGTVPNLGGITNNYATVYDTSFLGHLNRDGSTFGNSAYLSPVTRVTDTQSGGGSAASLLYTYQAGIGGAGMAPDLTNSNTTLLTIGNTTGAQYIFRFNPSGTNKGLPCSSAMGGCTPWYVNTASYSYTMPTSDIWITEAQNAGVACTSSATCGALVGFGNPQFDRNNPNLEYSFGIGSDPAIVAPTGATTTIPYYISPTTGKFWAGTVVADFKYGLPQYQASDWATSTAYSYGQYVIHPLTTSEMATGGAWTTGNVYAVGDIVTGGAGGTGCMYKVVTATGTSTTGSAPAFKTTNCQLEDLTDAAGNVWQDTSGTAQFLYQETNPACTVASPCTSSGSTFQWLATPGTICSTSASSNLAAGATTVTCTTASFTAAMVGQTIGIPGAGVSGGTFYTTILSVASPPSATATLEQPTVTATPATTAVTISLTGHPDILSKASGLDANGLVWTNIENSYVPVNANSWSGNGYTSIDQNNTITISGAPGSPFSGASIFAAAFATNSYGKEPPWSGATPLKNYLSGQGASVDAIVYDAGSNASGSCTPQSTSCGAYHHLNTITGIWTDYYCSAGTGYNCSGGSWTRATVGTLQAISNTFPSNTPPNCPWGLHDVEMSKSGQYLLLSLNRAPAVYKGCATGATGLEGTMFWTIPTANYDQYKSLQYTFGGLNHFAWGYNRMVFFGSNSGWGATTGVYLGSYMGNNAQGNTTGNPVVGSGAPSPFITYLPPWSSQTLAQSWPNPGCYVTSGSTIKNPDCNPGEALDSHLSMAADPGTDTWPACGSVYNYATLNPVPFNAWQGMEMCFQTSTLYPVGYSPNSGYTSIAPYSGPICTPGSSGNCTQTYGNVWQFSHCFNTGTSISFSTQFCISEYSQDGNWMFVSSDWDGANGSTLTGNAAPAVWTSGTYYQQLLQTATSSTAAPIFTPPTTLAGTPWLPSSSYGAGNLINPIEGTTGKGTVDDVFQAQNSGTSGAFSTVNSSQPACLNYASAEVSCFANTNSPTSGTVTPSGASEVGSTSSYTFTGAALTVNVGVKVTLAGWSPSGYNGTWAVTGTVGTGCPGTACGSISTWQLTGLPTSLGAVTTFGTAAAQGDLVCDSPNDNGSGNVNGFNLSSCPGGGVQWADSGPQTQRGDVFAVNLGLN
jgi:hypothetical protein